ncbi:TIM-barrel domain-containing protein [uncultured Acetobacteroides sp.]|uniref:glycoside hydrolase family 31 protein n=1 Tax=uncultured Acetobacteroides sp. TaxID=1760811 RepID=UPI0029F4633D|nr:TIM-barrel domain-containing protein [uncultured Acetobacteroides sp.]
MLLLAVSISGKAQTYQKTDYGVTAVVNAVRVELQLYGPSTVRVVKYPEGKTFEKQSLSVIQKPQKVAFSVRQSGDKLSLRSVKMEVLLNLKTGTVAFANQQVPLMTEKEAGATFADFDDAGVKTFTVAQSFVLGKDEAIYGLGQQQEGKMSKRNLKLNMVQGNTDDYIPFFLSSKGYGVFWDNYSPTVFEDSPEQTLFKSDVGDGIDYYFMLGDNADGVVGCMRNLTGQAPMFPLWTYGFWQSRERYKSQDELVGVVKRFRELGVPLDGIIQDWQYWGNNYLWNAMEFLNPGFYDPRKMVSDVHGMNAHMIISIWNSFGPMTKQYRDLDRIGALYRFKTWPESGSEKWPPNQDYPSGVRVYDPYNPSARDIYWSYLNKGIFSLGMDGWWMDSSEPDHLDPKPSDFDTQTYLGSFRKVRNAFPLMTVGGVSQHQRSLTSEKRVFILTRSAFAGQQRYGANTWSGDVVASWDALRNQISAGLNFSLCGIPYWNSDLGGFFLWKFKNPLENTDYWELHVRWIQLGTFCPMMRSHGEGVPREIYQFGEKGNPTYDAIAKYINMRYLLLPYIYSTSWSVTANHSSMMRALVMDFAADGQALDINDEFMFGKSLLVSPVSKPMYSKKQVKGADTLTVEDYSTVKTKEVYLPRGADWYDFWTGAKLGGGQTVKKEAPLDIIPLYVRAGAILPIGPKVQYATEKRWDNLEIRVYRGANGEFTLYEDENDSYNYEKGAYSLIKLEWNDKRRCLIIGDRIGAFPGMMESRTFSIVLVDTAKGTGTSATEKFDPVVRYKGKRVEVKL